MTLPILPASSPGGRSTRGSHQLSAVRTCERNWYLRYVLRYSGLIDKPFRMKGTLIHLALAYHYASKLTPIPSWFFEKELTVALEEKGVGFPAEILLAKEVLIAYRDYYKEEEWIPRYVEQEFAAKVGEIDPNGVDEQIDVLVTKPGDAGHPRFEKRWLNDEEITCRPDLIVEAGGALWIIDHKTSEGAYGRNQTRLETWKDDGAFALDWQVMLNLHVMRLRLGDVRGFIIQRIKRRPPWDFDRHPLMIPAWAYNEVVPREIRACVKAEHEVRKKVALGTAPAAAIGWACYGRYGPCDFWNACKANTQAEAQAVLASEFTTES